MKERDVSHFHDERARTKCTMHSGSYNNDAFNLGHMENGNKCTKKPYNNAQFAMNFSLDFQPQVLLTSLNSLNSNNGKNKTEQNYLIYYE